MNDMQQNIQSRFHRLKSSLKWSNPMSLEVPADFSLELLRKFHILRICDNVFRDAFEDVFAIVEDVADHSNHTPSVDSRVSS